MPPASSEPSALQVSPLCLGCMHFGTRNDEKTSFSLLDAYLDAGGNFLDTANNYACWIPGARGDESETLLGRWMRQRNKWKQMRKRRHPSLPLSLPPLSRLKNQLPTTSRPLNR